MAILLIRHGETALNRSRVIQPPDTPLNDHGEAQARALAQRIRQSPPAAIVASDMPRAARTAQIVAEATGQPIQYSELLRERFFGDWSGLAYHEVDFDPLDDKLAPPGGETMQQFRDRVQQATEWVLEQRANTNGVLAVFTHGLVIREMIDDSVSAADLQGEVGAVIRNTSVTQVSATQPFEINLMACATHLAALDAANEGGGPVPGQY
ncbi:MAG: histidine phosphatase family protein [Burkholderiaceae bacterium]